MRDKLIELIQSAVIGCPRYWAGLIADNLIAHGVTLAEDNNVLGKWIPVNERLPELRTKVLCCGERGGRFIAELAVSVFGPKNSVYWDRKNGKLCSKVTHWMPLPAAPKEVR